MRQGITRGDCDDCDRVVFRLPHHRLLTDWIHRTRQHGTEACMWRYFTIRTPTLSHPSQGMPMATNLIKAGHDLVVHDRTDAPAHLASAHGSHVTICSSPAELASQPDLTTVITMLPSAAAVQQVYTGPQGLLAASGGVTAPLLIDSSTIDPASSRMV